MLNRILPNFLVIGAEKAGTTWLHAQLKKHPEIFLPATKEVHFFNKYDSNLNIRDHFKLGMAWYTDFFSKYNEEKAVGEVTPMYLCDPEAPLRIKQILPEVKLIAILRDPVKRAYSHYNMALNKQHTDLSFIQIIQNEDTRFIKRGLYYPQLKQYYDLFKEEQMMVIFYEEVFKDPLYWLTQICTFLGVNADFYKTDQSIYDKVYQAPAYKSPGLLNIQNKFVHTMRRNRRLGKLLNWVKEKGFSDKIKKLNITEQPYKKLDDEAAKSLKKYYDADLEQLALLLKQELPF